MQSLKTNLLVHIVIILLKWVKFDLIITEPKHCPYQYSLTQDGKACFMVTDKVLTYDKAIKYCKESHGSLVAIDTKEKQASFETFIKSKLYF